jgi:hypothetical protein
MIDCGKSNHSSLRNSYEYRAKKSEWCAFEPHQEFEDKGPGHLPVEIHYAILKTANHEPIFGAC